MMNKDKLWYSFIKESIVAIRWGENKRGPQQESGKRAAYSFTSK